VRPWLTSGRLLPGLTVRRLLTATPAARPPNKTMSAETADNAGTPQLKRFHMVSTKTKFPRGIWIRSLAQEGATAHAKRAPGPGLKRQAPSFKRYKPQASSPKQQASSSKPQASSSKIREPRYRNSEEVFEDLGPRASAMIKVFSGCV